MALLCQTMHLRMTSSSRHRLSSPYPVLVLVSITTALKLAVHMPIDVALTSSIMFYHLYT